MKPELPTEISVTFTTRQEVKFGFDELRRENDKHGTP
jgi:hypothetical protein